MIGRVGRLLGSRELHHPAVDGASAADEVDALVEGHVVADAGQHEPGVAHRSIGDVGTGIAFLEQEFAIRAQVLAVEIGKRADQHSGFAVLGDELAAILARDRQGQEPIRRIAQRVPVPLVLVGGEPARVLRGSGAGEGSRWRRPGLPGAETVEPVHVPWCHLALLRSRTGSRAEYEAEGGEDHPARTQKREESPARRQAVHGQRSVGGAGGSAAGKKRKPAGW